MAPVLISVFRFYWRNFYPDHHQTGVGSKYQIIIRHSPAQFIFLLILMNNYHELDLKVKPHLNLSRQTNCGSIRATKVRHLIITNFHTCQKNINDGSKYTSACAVQSQNLNASRI